MKRNLAYLYYVLMHKYYVLVAGRKLGLGWVQLILHDWSKFTKEEFGPYARQFYNEDGSTRAGHSSEEFKVAWHHHQHRNKHHPQYWERLGLGAQDLFPMPERHVKEMVADWAGAGKAKTGKWDITEWFRAAHQHMNLHPVTNLTVHHLMEILREKL